MPLLGEASNSSTSVSAASAFEIEELSGDERLLQLVGRALPFRPIEIPTTMRAVATYCAGNPIGTLQVLGSTRDVVTVQGKWKDRFIQPTGTDVTSITNEGAAILDGELIQNVGELVRSVEDFTVKGQLVEIRWAEQTRRGVITRFVPKWDNVHDVEWELQFTLISDGSVDAPPTFMELDQQTIASELKAAVDNVLAGTKIVTWSNALLDEVNVLDAAIEEASDAARDTVAKTVSQVMAPVDAAKRMLGVLQHAIDSAQSLAEFTQARVDRAVSGLAITTPTFGETLEASYSIRNVRSCAIRSRSVALQHRESLRDTVGLRAAPATHIMRQGEDLRTVSTYYYGRPDEWRRIALFNGYDGASVPQGKLIAIPPATEDASQQGVA